MEPSRGRSPTGEGKGRAGRRLRRLGPGAILDLDVARRWSAFPLRIWVTRADVRSRKQWDLLE